MQPTAIPADANAGADPRRWLALAILAAAQFMVVLDASIVNVALPSIKDDLHFSQENLQWVVNAYTLAFGGFLMLGGRAADLFGRRRVFIAGLVVFSFASLAGGLATSEGWLIVARGLQGLGAAIVSPAALAIVTTTFTEGSERNKALGIWGALAGAGGAAGVLLGGVLTSGLGWEWVLFVNVPIGLVVGAAGPALRAREPDRGARPDRRRRRRARDRRPRGHRLRARRRRVGRLGLVPDHRAARPRRDRCCSPSWSRSCARSHPIMPLTSSATGTSRARTASALLVGASLFSMFFFISLYMQQVLRYSALKAGLGYLPLALLDHHRGRRGLGRWSTGSGRRPC